MDRNNRTYKESNVRIHPTITKKHKTIIDEIVSDEYNTFSCMAEVVEAGIDCLKLKLEGRDSG